jgi:hypothetical protein
LSDASAVSQAPAGRTQPAFVLWQIVASVQPGHALGAALVESSGRGRRPLAGLITTPSQGKIATQEIRRAKNSGPGRSIRNPGRRMLQKETRNLRAVQLLSGHTTLDSTVS